MPFPPDLPQPVRIHSAHKLPINGDWASSPGPSAYEGNGVTVFEKDHRGGAFASASDRKAGPQSTDYYQRQNRDRQLRSVSATTPGPGVYDNHLFKPNSTRVQIGFGRAKRPCLRDIGKSDSEVGPGAYFDMRSSSTLDTIKRPSSVTGTIPRARRLPLDNNHADEAAPGTYSPNVAPTRISHPGSSFPHASVRQRMAKSAAAVSHCQTKDASLAGQEEMDRAEMQTRPSRRVVSIPRAKRFHDGAAGGGAPSSGAVSGGDYDAVEASRVISHGTMNRSVGFARSTREAHAKHMLPRAADPELLGFSPGPDVLPSTLNGRGVRLSPQRPDSARSGRSSAQYSSSNNGGLNSPPSVVAGGNDPGAYTPDVSMTKPSHGGVSFPRSERFRDKYDAADGEMIILPSTLDTEHGAKIGSGKRFALSSMEKEAFEHPSPADYGAPLPSKRPESAARSILNRNEKLGQLLRDSRITPGPQYDVDEPSKVIRTNRAQQQLSFPRAKRGLVEKRIVKEDGPSPGDYDVRESFAAATRKKGAALLYLSG